MSELELSKFNKTGFSRRILYANASQSSLILDFKLYQDKITGFSKQEESSHEAIGVRQLEKVSRFDIMGKERVWLMRKVDDLLSCSY